MSQNIAQKIIARHLLSGEMKAGEEISLRIDQTLTQDSTGTMTYLQFEAMGIDKVKTDKSVAYIDHNTLQAGFENADDHKYIQTVTKKHGVYFSRPGNGICHQVHLERFGKPGATLLGSDSHTPTGGGLGMLPENKSFYKSLSAIPNLNTTVVCAKNSRLKEKLTAAALPNLTVLGCIDDVAERMASSDLFLTKPGGISTFEAIGTELPLLLFPPKLEQEIKNCNFIVRNGLGKQLSGNTTSYAEQIAFLINNDLKLADIRHSMHRLRMSFNAEAIMDFIDQEEGRLHERRAV